VSAALQIYYTRFDAEFFKLPQAVRTRIESRIDEIGLRLANFSHHRLTGRNRYRLRVGDYRIIYTFDAAASIIHLLAVGHRREIYRDLLSLPADGGACAGFGLGLRTPRSALRTCWTLDLGLRPLPFSISEFQLFPSPAFSLQPYPSLLPPPPLNRYNQLPHHVLDWPLYDRHRSKARSVPRIAQPNAHGI